MNVKFDGMHNEHPTNELCGTVIPQGTLSCPSGNSPCAAPAERSRYVYQEGIWHCVEVKKWADTLVRPDSRNNPLPVRVEG